MSGEPSDPTGQAREFVFTCPLAHGLHARPATRFVEVAERFASRISLIHQRSGAHGDGHSLLAIVAMDLAEGDECLVRISGPDADAACLALQRFVRDVLPTCDDAEPAAPERELVVPRVLRGAAVLGGTRICEGIGRGRVRILDGLAMPVDFDGERTGTTAEETTRFEQVAAAVGRSLEARRSASGSAVERGILAAHLSIASDPGLHRRIADELTGGLSLARAILAASAHFRARFEAAPGAVTRERALDVEDVCRQLLEEACGGPLAAEVALTGPTVIVAQDLTPGRFMALDRRHLAGLVLERAGATSHAMILAASFGVPTLTDVPAARAELADASEVILDANCGFVVRADAPGAAAHYERATARDARRAARLSRFVARPAATSDGEAFAVCANVGSAEECGRVFEQGAEGIGLFRTELLFLDRDTAPTEEEQYAIYRAAAKRAGSRPVTIRMFDIGGDKPAPYLRLPDEANPFLGYRGMRLYRDYPLLFVAQVRAILRAAECGNVRLMLPMVTNVAEVRWFREQLAGIVEDLGREGVSSDAALPVGMMVEVPSVALQLDHLAEEVDFFSIGTNDLTQYFFAADRGNERVRGLCEVRHPAFLRFLRQIVADAHRHGRRVSVCGEMARDPLNLPLLLGLGVDEVSVAGAAVLPLKAQVDALSRSHCRTLVEAALDAGDIGQLGAALEPGDEQAVASLCRPELIETDAPGDDRAGVIAALVDLLYANGRTDAPEAVEEAIWEREAHATTSIGHGIAIPHCRSDAVRRNALCVLRLRAPVSWGREDDEPVRLAIMLAIRTSEAARTHMRVLARLARRLVHEDFRTRLLAADRSEAIYDLLTRELDLA